ncbi:MAG: PEGA domain-containing protein [bacterium]|nr:PEGA domain-containing protein [bacterium]
MSQENDHIDEDQLRQEIRAEIEQREQELLKAREHKRDHTQFDVAERKRQLYQEELRKFYQQRPGYREVVAEDGEIDWVLEEDERKDLFDEVLEDPADARKRQKLFMIIGALVTITLALIIYLLLHQGEGSIQVNCNVLDAQVLLDATPLSQRPGELIEQIPAGEHVVTVTREGYKIVGPEVIKVTLRSGENLVLNFTLEPNKDGKTDSKDVKPKVKP